MGPHPSLKPQDFLRQLVRGVLPLGEGVVLDPFCGAGSTLAAAEAVGYRSVGIENDPLALIWKNVHLKGILVGNRRELDEMTKAIDRNGLKPVIDRRFPFAEAPAAYRYLASGAHFGKVVINHD